MPFNHTRIENCLKNCDQDLYALFADQRQTNRFRQQIKEVRDYYNLSYTRATNAKTVDKIALSYVNFVKQLQGVKEGTTTFDQAVKSIANNSESRKLNTVFHNIGKLCELIFWAATAFSLFSGIWGLALPLLVLQPSLGAAVGITMAGAMLAAAYKGLACLAELKSFSRHDTEYTNEVNLVSFFKPASERHVHFAPDIETYEEEQEEQEPACCF